MIEPHVRAYLEAMQRLRRVAGFMGAVDGVEFDPETFAFYRDLGPDA